MSYDLAVCISTELMSNILKIHDTVNAKGLCCHGAAHM